MLRGRNQALGQQKRSKNELKRANSLVVTVSLGIDLELDIGKNQRAKGLLNLLSNITMSTGLGLASIDNRQTMAINIELGAIDTNT
ncbi:hypothetical protein E3N88_24238 [Mikania micrantha]|uniref:Uncharacterized protein n=1 Tax=Mikania micrantha TaxID=192012 RepID=A0A5N6NHV8_9ASTR|nr:hypothetical protein E3N88_24238 [Mikania micrantha]